MFSNFHGQCFLILKESNFSGFWWSKNFSFNSDCMKYFIIKFIAELEMQNSFQLPSPIFSTSLKDFFLTVFIREMQFPLFYQYHWWLYHDIDLTRIFSSATHWISANRTRALAIHCKIHNFVNLGLFFILTQIWNQFSDFSLQNLSVY